MRRLFSRLSCCLVLVFIVQTLSAATITTFSRDGFHAALSGGAASGQDFDGIADLTVIGTVNGVTYAASGGSALVTDSFLTTTPLNGLGSTSFGFFGPAETATISFASPITAFAIDINTFDPVAGSYTGTLNVGDTVSSVFDVFPGFATGQFLGFLSDTPFSSIAISAPGGFSYTLDTLIYGEAERVIEAQPQPIVPEPSTISLILGGLAFLLLKRRKGSRATTVF